MTEIDKSLERLQLLYDQGDYDGANLLVERLSEEYPNESRVFRFQGLLLQTLGRFKEATLAFDDAVRLNAKDADSLFGRAFCHLQIGSWRRVIADCTLGLDLGSEYHLDTLLMFRAEALISLGRTTEAKADLQRVSNDCKTWTYRLRTKNDLLSLL